MFTLLRMVFAGRRGVVPAGFGAEQDQAVLRGPKQEVVSHLPGGGHRFVNVTAGVADIDPSSREFLGIILEEVDRLDRVVGSVLDYARPTKGNPAAVDVNGIVRRTVQILQRSSSV